MRHKGLVKSPNALSEQLFQQLAQEWRADTMHLSFIEDMAMHPAYQRIIGMGAPVVPLILRELQEQPDHWLWALQAITGEDPAQPTDTFDQAVAAWLQWGKEQGYVS